MPVLDPKAIGRRLELLRESRSLSQRELSKKAGIAQSAISDFEKGKRLPTVKALNKLLTFFEVDPADLMLGVEESPEAAKRRYLEKGIQERLNSLSIEAVAAIAQFVEQLYMIEKPYYKQIRRPEDSTDANVSL